MSVCDFLTPATQELQCAYILHSRTRSMSKTKESVSRRIYRRARAIQKYVKLVSIAARTPVYLGCKNIHKQ